MFKFNLISLLPIFLFLFAGCKKDDSPNPSLTAGPATLSAPREAGSVVFNIVSNQKWTLTSDQPWATLSTNGGSNDGIITINYETNVMAARQATITVSGGGIEAKVKLNQAGALDATSSSSPNPLPYSKGTFTVWVSSTTAWKLNIQDSTWLKSNLYTGMAATTTLTLSHALNYGTGTRTNALQFSDENNNLLQTLSVSQLNSNQANLLFYRNWKMYKEYIVKVKPTGDSLYRDLIVSTPCEVDDWLQISPDTITFFQGPVQCDPLNPQGIQKMEVVFNEEFTQVSVPSSYGPESYQIKKLTSDSLIIESIPPYPRSLKAKRWMIRKP